MIISPHNSNRLYFAANYLFQSDNNGDSWKKISTDLTRNEDRIGSARDLQLRLRRAKQVLGDDKNLNVMVVAGDSIFYKTFTDKSFVHIFI